MRKWISNSSKILDKLHADSGKDRVNLGQGENTKTLGLYWNSYIDKLFFDINTQDVTTFVTKCNILSQAAQIFDPIDLLVR